MEVFAPRPPPPTFLLAAALVFLILFSSPYPLEARAPQGAAPAVSLYGVNARRGQLQTGGRKLIIQSDELHPVPPPPAPIPGPPIGPQPYSLSPPPRT